MHEGFIHLWRKILVDGMIKNKKLFPLWVYLLLTAQYRPIQSAGKTISPGQLLTTLTKLSDAVGLTRQEVRTGLKNLQIQDRISIFTTRQHTLITIIKWAAYQKLPETSIPQPKQPQPKQPQPKQPQPKKSTIWIMIDNLPPDLRKKLEERAFSNISKQNPLVKALWHKEMEHTFDNISKQNPLVKALWHKEMEKVHEADYLKKSQIGLPI